ncbi:MAG TPA: hypothetical protein VNN73_08900 [Blastocatellia bacterium]|nr:hypothetical protein [Blastocatellia bacterium]
MNPSSHQSSQGGWAVSYTQSDVDTIREQIEQNESAKRRWLVLALVIILAALVGAVALLTTSYALYSKSESEKKRLSDENASLKATTQQQEQQLNALMAEKQKQEQARAEAKAQMEKLQSSASLAKASDAEIAAFAKLISELPQGKIELNEKPPDKIFRNYRVRTESGTQVYTLVPGGPFDGKWVIYSNLVRQTKSDAK